MLAADGAGGMEWKDFPPSVLETFDIDTLAKLNALVIDATLVDSGSLASVAFSGDYANLSGKPTLGTAAATDASDYATAAQGALADTSIQPGDPLTDLASHGAVDGQVPVANGTGGIAWSTVSGGESGGSGDMAAATYDPQSIASDAFARANHTGVQAISTVTGLQTALDDKLESTDIDTLNKLNTLLSDATVADINEANAWAGQQTFEGGFKEAWGTLSGTTPTLTHGNAIWTLSGASTPTDGLADGETLVLHVIGGDTHSVTWPGTWIGGSQPTLAGDDMIVMWKHSGTLYAKYAGAF
jgi:hypothetical protein